MAKKSVVVLTKEEKKAFRKQLRELATAMELGSTFRRKAVGSLFKPRTDSGGLKATCALGAAYEGRFGRVKVSAGEWFDESRASDKLDAEFPVLLSNKLALEGIDPRIDPSTGDYYHSLNGQIITLNDEKRVSREEIAARIRRLADGI